MASINGDWFHSRSSSNLEELLKVRALVIESQKLEYIGVIWSGGRENNNNLRVLASICDIQPSTMQTKLRAMIRYGFIKDGNTCPILWTRMGSLWNELYTFGNYSIAKQIYELILTISLALYAFNDTQKQYSINPSNGQMPLKFLLNTLDINDSITLSAFSVLVDGNSEKVAKNYSYWKSDLINSGLFIEKNGNLVYTGKFRPLIDEIKKFTPNPLLTDYDWENIRDNPLIDISPFSISIRDIFYNIINIPEEGHIGTEGDTEPIIQAISDEEEKHIPELDILGNNERFTNSSRRVRSSIWSNRIKRKYQYICAVSNCDVEGQFFVDAAHIKPDSVPEEGIPHRTHILNGLCLCKHCHVAFDKGFFTLSDDYQIIVSREFEKIPSQNLKRVILSSQGMFIKPRNDGRLPLLDFIQYHRSHKFKE